MFPIQSFDLLVSDAPESVSRRVAAHASGSALSWWWRGDKTFYGFVSLRGFRLVLLFRHRGPPVILIGRFAPEPKGTRVRVAIRPPVFWCAFWVSSLVGLIAATMHLIIHGGDVLKGALPFLFCLFFCVFTIRQSLWRTQYAVELITRLLLDTPPENGRH